MVFETELEKTVKQKTESKSDSKIKGDKNEKNKILHGRTMEQKTAKRSEKKKKSS